MENRIENRCKEKELELLNQYFGNLHNEAAIDRPETIGKYPKDFSLKIEAEFREYLIELWKEYSEIPLVLEGQKLRWLMTEEDCEAIDAAYKGAKCITLWISTYLVEGIRRKLSRKNKPHSFFELVFAPDYKNVDENHDRIDLMVR